MVLPRQCNVAPRQTFGYPIAIARLPCRPAVSPAAMGPVAVRLDSPGTVPCWPYFLSRRHLQRAQSTLRDLGDPEMSFWAYPGTDEPMVKQRRRSSRSQSLGNPCLVATGEHACMLDVEQTSSVSCISQVVPSRHENGRFSPEADKSTEQVPPSEPPERVHDAPRKQKRAQPHKAAQCPAQHRLNLPLPSAANVEPSSIDGEPEWRKIVAALSAADRLAQCSSLTQVLETAVMLARDYIGLERAGIYLAEPPPSRLLRGGFGTGISGETIDEQDVAVELSEAEHHRLHDLPSHGARWLYFEDTDHVAQEREGSVVIGRGWLAVTPLICDGELLGVLHNDSAFTHAAVDWGKQACAAVFCSFVAIQIAARQKAAQLRPVQRESERSSVVRRVQRTLDVSPCVSGEQLARELSISAGYLARVFRTEVGMSLVEYRNQLRIGRFLRMVEHEGGNLCEAAIEAGFGSYAQFHRVFRRHVGTTPREYVTGTQMHGARAQSNAASG
jgi:AraC-like DNA-binding protein